jgi:hypothetical protein
MDEMQRAKYRTYMAHFMRVRFGKEKSKRLNIRADHARCVVTINV